MLLKQKNQNNQRGSLLRKGSCEYLHSLWSLVTRETRDTDLQLENPYLPLNKNHDSIHY